MKKLKNFLKKFSKFWWIGVLLLLIPSFSRLIHKGFFPTQDYIYVARIYEMDKSLKDGQFPVRWAPDLRYGEPLFNFYAPLPYYVGSLVHTFNISFLDTSKILYALGLVLSFFSMYLLGRELWGKIGGLISAFVYLYAPYRALDVFVRGDVSESWVFIFFPLMFWGALRLSRKVNGKNIALVAFSLAGLFLTHNVMTMLIAPFFILWIIYLAWREKKLKRLIPLVLASALGVGVAATFLLPAYFEKSFIQTQHLTGGYFDFRAHFVELRQFFSTFWGYGASTWLGEDGMSFQLGVIQWAILGIVGIFAFIKRKTLKKESLIYVIGVIFVMLLISLFLQHNKSTFIWLHIPILQYVQFPWRFMALSTFFAGILAGSLSSLLPKIKYSLLGIVIISLIIANYNYFRPESYYDDSIDAHYTTQVFQKDDKMPKDYLPIWVKKISDSKITKPVVASGEAVISDYSSRSNSATFDLVVGKDSTIDVPVTFFPGWSVKLNGKKVALDEPSDLGLIRFSAQPGQYKAAVHFDNTPLRTAGNLVSAISIGAVLYLGFFSKKIFRKTK